jgi:hypothetical protein
MNIGGMYYTVLLRMLLFSYLIVSVWAGFHLFRSQSLNT